MLLRSLLAASVAAIAFAAPASANLLSNGGFETGSFNGWSLTGDTSYTSVAGSAFGYNPQEGSQQAIFGSVGGAGYLSQSVSTDAGATYTLTFKLANYGGTPSSFSVSLDGATLASQTNAGQFNYTDFSYSTVASGSSMTLLFTFFQQPAYYFLDAVSLDQTAPADVPEPAMLGLFGLGALGLGLSRRRKAA